MNPRVLVVTNMYPTPSKPWFGTFVKEQVEALRELGVHIDVLSFEGGNTNVAYARAALAVRRAAPGYDVIHAHHGLSGAIAVGGHKTPVITTFHGSDTGRKRWQLTVARRVAQRSTPVIVEPGAAARLRAPRARLLACGVDTNLFVPLDRAEARRRAGWTKPGPYLLFPSSPQRSVKRYDLFALCVEEYTRRYGPVNTACLEGCDREGAAARMAAADVVVLTSDSEGSPVAVKEALACCTPVVSVPVGDVHETLGSLPGCAVVDRRPEALAAAVHTALDTGPTRALRERASRYSNERVATRLLELYRQVGADAEGNAADISA